MVAYLTHTLLIRLHTIVDGAAQTRKRVFPVSESRIVEQFNRRFGAPQQMSASQLILAVELGKSAVFQVDGCNRECGNITYIIIVCSCYQKRQIWVGMQGFFQLTRTHVYNYRLHGS